MEECMSCSLASVKGYWLNYKERIVARVGLFLTIKMLCSGVANFWFIAHFSRYTHQFGEMTNFLEERVVLCPQKIIFYDSITVTLRAFKLKYHLNLAAALNINGFHVPRMMESDYQKFSHFISPMLFWHSTDRQEILKSYQQLRITSILSREKHVQVRHTSLATDNYKRIIDLTSLCDYAFDLLMISIFLTKSFVSFTSP